MSGERMLGPFLPRAKQDFHFQQDLVNKIDVSDQCRRLKIFSAKKISENDLVNKIDMSDHLLQKKAKMMLDSAKMDHNIDFYEKGNFLPNIYKNRQKYGSDLPTKLMNT
jgi:hypothetical protein